MTRRTILTAVTSVAMAVGIAAMPLAHADPLTPLTSNELEFLSQLRKVFSVKHDPAAFRSDGELLTQGQWVCAQRDVGHEGQAATYQTPALTQLAFIYLCP